MTSSNKHTTDAANAGLLWWWSVLGLVASVIVAYWPALSNGFVWDDGANILHNPHFRGLGWSQIYWAFTNTHLSLYQPLAWLSRSVDYVIWGENPFGYHLTSLLLHALNTILFARLALELLAIANQEDKTGWIPNVTFRVLLGSWLAAAIFALHPMRVESVAWISSRHDVLAGAFFFLSLLAWFRAVPAGPDGDVNRRWYWAAVALFALSILSFPLAMGGPLVLLLLDWYPLRRVRSGDSWENWRSLLWEKAPFLLVSIGSGIIALVAKSTVFVPIEHHGWWSRILQAGYGVMFYLRSALSLGWYPLYERPQQIDPLEPAFVLSLVTAIGITVGFFVLRRRFPAGLAAWICYLVLIAPVLGWAQAGSQIVADRYTYLACLSWALLAGGCLAFLWDRSRRRLIQGILATTALAVLSLWSVLTWQQTRIWHDEERLWQHVLEGGPSGTAYSNLAAINLQRRDFGSALTLLRHGLGVAPNSRLIWTNLRSTFEYGGSQLDPVEVRQTAGLLRDALPSTPRSAVAWYTVGLAHSLVQNWPEAALHFEQAVRIRPDFGDAWIRLGAAQASAGRCVRLEPESTGAWTSYGLCLNARGQTQAAFDALRRAVDLDPNNEYARSLLQRIEPSINP